MRAMHGPRQPESNPMTNEITRAVHDTLQEYQGFFINDEAVFNITEAIVNEVDLTLVGLAKAAELMGISAQRVRQLVNKDKMPHPATVVETGQYTRSFWLLKDIEKFVEERQPLRDQQRQLTQRQTKYEQ